MLMLFHWSININSNCWMSILVYMKPFCPVIGICWHLHTAKTLIPSLKQFHRYRSTLSVRDEMRHEQTIELNLPITVRRSHPYLFPMHEKAVQVVRGVKDCYVISGHIKGTECQLGTPGALRPQESATVPVQAKGEFTFSRRHNGVSQNMTRQTWRLNVAFISIRMRDEGKRSDDREMESGHLLPGMYFVSE